MTLPNTTASTDSICTNIRTTDSSHPPPNNKNGGTGTDGGSWLNYIRLGAKLHTLEWVLLYLLPCTVWFVVLPSPSVVSLLVRNAIGQVLLFVSVVHIPAYVFERMVYVDLGWPSGLVLIGVVALWYGDGLPLRRYWIGGMLVCQGGRMALGALLKFGQMSGWTYRFPEDLSRYRYAKHRWVHMDRMPADKWWIKIQHDCAQQGFANIAILSIPVFIAACNDRAGPIRPLEGMGWALWCVSFLWENVADYQKIVFDVQQHKRKQMQQPAPVVETSRPTTEEVRVPINNNNNQEAPRYVLGYAPCDGWASCVWTWCRHPNYLGELGCWTGIMLVGMDSIWSTTACLWGRVHLLVLHLGMVRFLYDCLVWWTGAAPAEYYSSKRRPLYRDYQTCTPCLFPRPLTLYGRLLPEYRIPGWPDVPDDS